MKVPLSWLKDYIDINLEPAEIAKILTMAGLEVDGYETIGSNFSGIVVGLVVSAEKHPNADKLTLATVSDGTDKVQVVCGAPNCREGIKVAFAKIGAVIKDDQGEFQIKKSKLRGVESFGMLCSAKELNLGQESDGILELPDYLMEGTSLNEVYGDTIFEISLTPNLGHCASILGVARELSAATNICLRYPDITCNESKEKTSSCITVDVRNALACPRYTCRIIKGVKVGPSPEWLKSRLELSGIRSINNVVDVTNYVLLEMGHPLHAFDYSKIEGQKIVVKNAEEGELFTTLDGKQRSLKGIDLLIQDHARPIAIAGVMGGQDSEVRETTVDIALESAYFDAVSVRKTSKHLGLQTDSSKRFERGTDPNQLLTSLNRAAMLIQYVAGGEILSEAIDTATKEFPRALIKCRLNRVNDVLGLVLGAGEVENILKSIGFECSWDGLEAFNVYVPTYRVDVTSEIDLVEEVARMYGYDNIPRKGGRFNSSHLPSSSIYIFEKLMRERMIAEGLQEFLTCDLIGPTILQIVNGHDQMSPSMVPVLNPTSVEQSILRTSLLPGLLQVAKYNYDHQNHDFGGFEIGRIHFKKGEDYKEQSVLGILLTGFSRHSHWDVKPLEYDFFDFKGIVENLLSELGIKNAEFKNLHIDTLHSGRQASVFVDSLEVGSFGEIHPSILRRLDLPQRIIFGEFDLQDLMKVSVPVGKVKALTIYPSSSRDWTLTVNQSVSYGSIVSYIEGLNSTLLEEIAVVDIYRNEKLGEEYQNVTLRFVYRDPTKTIEQEGVDREHERIVTQAIKYLADSIKIELK